MERKKEANIKNVDQKNSTGSIIVSLLGMNDLGHWIKVAGSHNFRGRRHPHHSHWCHLSDACPPTLSTAEELF